MASPVAKSLSALNGLALVNIPGVMELSDAGPAARFVFRGPPSSLAAAIGADDVSTPLRATVSGGTAALWQGPDEWLLLVHPGQAAAVSAAIAAATDRASGCLVDITHRNIGLSLAGPRAADVLASGCPLDFDPTAFPVGMCTRTIFGKAEVVAWRLEKHVFRLETGRSFAPYVVGLIETCVRTLPSPLLEIAF